MNTLHYVAFTITTFFSGLTFSQNYSGCYTEPETSAHAVTFVPVSTIAGDFNGDNILDIASLDAGSHSVSVLIGTGNGSFSFGSNTPLGTLGLTNIEAADLDNDNDLEILVTNRISNTLVILKHTLNGEFVISGSYTTEIVQSPDVTGGLYDLSINDFNNDGKLDVVVVDDTESQDFPVSAISVFYGNGDCTLSSAVNFITTGSFYSVTSSDFNGDELPDIAAVNFTDSLSVLFNDGTGGFLPLQKFKINGIDIFFDIESGDLNNDGFNDIVCITNDKLIILEGNPSNSFASPVITILSTDTDHNSNILLKDFNADGNLDVIRPEFQSNRIEIMHGHGDFTFTNNAGLYASGTYNVSSVTSGDFNNDTKLDLAASHIYNTFQSAIPDSISILLSQVPSILTIQGPTELCLGEQTTLTVNGGTNYIWSNGETDNSIYTAPVNTPSIITFSVMDNTNPACSSISFHSINIQDCADLQTNENSIVTLYPNPTSSDFTIECDQESRIEIYDAYGHLVDFRAAPHAQIEIINALNYEAGSYFIKVLSPNSENSPNNYKIIKL